MIFPKDDPSSVEHAASSLSSGKIVVIPTDTIYGFSGIVDVEMDSQFHTGDRIRQIKGRDETKPFIHLIANPEDIRVYTNDTIPEELLSKWPGALSIVVRVKPGSPLESEGKTAAFRCPDDPWLRSVINAVGAPIYSTSVNRSGQAPLVDVAEIEKQFGSEVDLIVFDGDMDKDRLPSTIVSLLENGKYTIIRQGSVILEKPRKSFFLRLFKKH